MTNLSFSAEVWTPRWGHTDTYSVKMTDSEMVVSQGMHNARCTLGNNGDPQWDGENQYRHPLFGMFNNEKIYPPEILPRALEWALCQRQSETAPFQPIRKCVATALRSSSKTLNLKALLPLFLVLAFKFHPRADPSISMPIAITAFSNRLIYSIFAPALTGLGGFQKWNS